MNHKRKEDKPNQEHITWRIIHKNIGYNERKYTEAIEIQKQSGEIMNVLGE
jgi:hypothetical protein